VPRSIPVQVDMCSHFPCFPELWARYGTSEQIILVVPWWMAGSWFSLLMSLLVDFHFTLPNMLYLSTQEIQEQGRAQHADLKSFHFMVWQLRYMSCKQLDFQSKLSAFYSDQLVSSWKVYDACWPSLQFGTFHETWFSMSTSMSTSPMNFSKIESDIKYTLSREKFFICNHILLCVTVSRFHLIQIIQHFITF
jgi:hypothetical protein